VGAGGSHQADEFAALHGDQFRSAGASECAE
jgi:hypothetical protein